MTFEREGRPPFSAAVRQVDTSRTPPGNDDFARQLTAEDELGSVVRAHLHIEFHVDQLIKVTAPNPEAVSSLNLSYAGRVRLLSVLGYKENLTKPLLALGVLRNKFSHRLNFKLGPEDVKTLYDTFDAASKEGLVQSYANSRTKWARRHPADVWALAPKDIFSLLASSMRAMLLVAYKQQTGSFPEGTVPAAKPKLEKPITDS